MSVAQERDYLTVAQAAALLQVDSSTIRRWIDQGRLPAYRVGDRHLRLRRADVDRLVVPAPGGSGEDTGSSLEALRRDLMTPLTPEERRHALAAMDAAEELARQIAARYGGEPFTPPSEDIINEMREERTRELP